MKIAQSSSENKGETLTNSGSLYLSRNWVYLNSGFMSDEMYVSAYGFEKEFSGIAHRIFHRGRKINYSGRKNDEIQNNFV